MFEVLLCTLYCSCSHTLITLLWVVLTCAVCSAEGLRFGQIHLMALRLTLTTAGLGLRNSLFLSRSTIAK